MTVIAYKDGVMACDSAWSEDSQLLITRATKIFRLPSGALIGEAGGNDTRAFHDLLKNVKTPRQLPSRMQLMALQMDYTAILVLPKGRVFQVEVVEPEEHKSHWQAGVYEITEGFHAIGSGHEHAITALECKRSAREAVYAAIRRNNQCRPPVHQLELNPKRKEPKR